MVYNLSAFSRLFPMHSYKLNRNKIDISKTDTALLNRKTDLKFNAWIGTFAGYLIEMVRVVHGTMLVVVVVTLPYSVAKR